MKNLLAILLLATISQICLADSTRQIYLVRHAEKQADGTKDPSLTKQGHKRAEQIAKILANKSIKAIYSSDYKRTQQTATPLAKQLDLQVISYHPGKLEAFSKLVLASDGNLLIVGHSNTTPNLSVLLGGESFNDIDESEYDRIYKLSISAKEVKSTLLYSTPRFSNKKSN